MDYLATQSANGTYQDEVDRENLQKEVEALKEEFDSFRLLVCLTLPCNKAQICGAPPPGIRPDCQSTARYYISTDSSVG